MHQINSIQINKIWKEGAAEALRQIEPEAVFLYGEDIGFDFGDIEVIHLENQTIRRLRNNGR